MLMRELIQTNLLLQPLWSEEHKCAFLPCLMDWSSKFNYFWVFFFFSSIPSQLFAMQLTCNKNYDSNIKYLSLLSLSILDLQLTID